MTKRVSLRLSDEHEKLLYELQNYYNESTNGVFNYTESDIIRLAIFFLHKEIGLKQAEEE